METGSRVSKLQRYCAYMERRCAALLPATSYRPFVRFPTDPGFSRTMTSLQRPQRDTWRPKRIGDAESGAWTDPRISSYSRFRIHSEVTHHEACFISLVMHDAQMPLRLQLKATKVPRSDGRARRA
jgi:hypothetical protein